MSMRYFFKDELNARRAVSDINNLGYWAITFKIGLPSGAVCGVECSDLAEGICESRYAEFIV